MVNTNSLYATFGDTQCEKIPNPDVCTMKLVLPENVCSYLVNTKFEKNEFFTEPKVEFSRIWCKFKRLNFISTVETTYCEVTNANNRSTLDYKHP